MQEFIALIVFIVAGVVALVTKAFDSVMYASVGVFALILFIVDMRQKRAKAPSTQNNREENIKEKPKGLTTGLFQ